MAGLMLIANGVSPAEDVDKTRTICTNSIGTFAMMDFIGLKAMYSDLSSAHRNLM